MIVFKVRKKERRIAERRTPRVTDYPLTNKERRVSPRRSILDRRIISISLIQQHNRLGGN